MKHDLTPEEAIHDLKVLGEFFKAQTGGSVPMCIEYAIKKIEDDDSTLVYEKR